MFCEPGSIKDVAWCVIVGVESKISVKITHASTVPNDVIGQVAPVICKLFPVAKDKSTIDAEAMGAPLTCQRTQYFFFMGVS